MAQAQGRRPHQEWNAGPSALTAVTLQLSHSFHWQPPSFLPSPMYLVLVVLLIICYEEKVNHQERRFPVHVAKAQRQSPGSETADPVLNSQQNHSFNYQTPNCVFAGDFTFHVCA